jgi:non-specific serine/threonine protein kinase/serine/threonine-protein kinase
MREESLFIAALGKENPTERVAFLDQECAGDPALRERIDKLLVSHEQTGNPLDAPPPVATVDDPLREGPGMVIGPYKLIEEIGEGGMGTVWMAQQTAPIRRLVAVKVIKPGMDSKQVLARFEAERQALALMDHPNIAKVLDAGYTGVSPQESGVNKARDAASLTPNPCLLTRGLGRPFFVMELVKGVPLTKYCDEHRLTPKQRLELFVPVCMAIQHAHQKGVIHRDIKPSNVLVAQYDGTPVPKVIDFGIAKATGQQLTERTLVTGFGAVVGTLEYMSPEQAELNQLDIDTRGDIYSLGVLLYELLTGSTPLDRKRLKQAALLEVLRVIREEEPPQPSTRLSTTDELPSVAANRGLEPKKLSRLVRGELDWIVMKALEKDRNRRYETANGLAADVLRYLANEPVHAGPASAGYRVRKFVRRHRGAALTAGMLLAVLLAGVAISTWQAIRATRSEAAERRSAEIARAINRYLIEDLFDAATPEEAQGRKITVEEVLDRASVKVDTAFPDQPEVEAGVRLAIGQLYLSLSLYGKAEPHLGSALKLRIVHLGADHIDTLEAMQQVGWLCAKQGKLDEAEHHHRQALDGFRRVAGKEHRSTMQQMFSVAWVVAERHQYDKAERLLRDCLEMQHRVLGEGDPDTLETMGTLSAVMIHQAKWKDAEPLARQCLDIMLRVLGENKPSTLYARRTVILVLREKGKWLEAQRLGRENVAAARRIFPPLHRETLLILEDLGSLDWRLARFLDAENELRESRDGWRQLMGADQRQTLAMSGRLAMALLDCGQLEEADREAREALEMCRRVKGPQQQEITVASLARFGKMLRFRGRWREAEKCLQEAEEGCRLRTGLDDAAFLLEIMRERAVVLQALGRHDEARSRFWQVLESQRHDLPPDHPDLAETIYRCGEYLLEVGKAADAKSLLEEALRIQREALPPEHPAVGQSLVALGWAQSRAGELAEGERPLREGLAIVSNALPTSHWFPAEAQGRLGDCLTTLKQFDEAEPLLTNSYEKLRVAPGTPPAQRIQAIERLVHYFELTGQKEKAAAWRLKRADQKKSAP